MHKNSEVILTIYPHKRESTKSQPQSVDLLVRRLYDNYNRLTYRGNMLMEKP